MGAEPAERVERVAGAPRIAVGAAGSGPLLVFLHGIGGNRRNWDPQLPAFAGAFTAAAWDARGYGDSEDYDGPLDFADFSADLVRVLDHFGAERAHLCGLSMGGRIAQDFYARHPDRVASLALCATFAGDDPRDPRASRTQTAEEFVESRIRPWLDGAPPAGLAAEAVGRLTAPGRPDAAFRAAVAAHEALRAESYVKTVRASAGFDRVAGLARIRVPALLVFGAEDPLTPPRVGEYMRERIPGARLEIVPGAGHLVNLEKPDAFNRVLRAFLAGHRRPPGAVARGGARM